MKRETFHQLVELLRSKFGTECEKFTYIERKTEGAEVHYLFVTGSETHGHSGTIVFCSDTVQHLTPKYNVDRQPASMLPESREENGEGQSPSQSVD